ncbi:MAG: hypothetical protein WC455_21295 [Dehalococcoidia bacterium]|jgi:hypothetical protein
MKKIIAILMLLMLVGATSAAWYPQKVNVPVTNYDNITLVDDKYMFFGTGADAAISYDSSEDKFYINNTPVYLEEAVTLGAGFTGGAISATSVTATGTIRGEQLTSTDDALIYGTLTANDVVSNTTVAASDITASDDAIITDDLVVDGAARIDEASTIASLTINSTLDTNGDATFENVSLTQNKKLIFNTAGTGYIQWLTSGNYMTIKGNPQFDDGYTWSGTASPSSGSDLTAIGGASDIDYSLSSGILTTPTGANTLSGDTTISGAKTFTSGTGAVTLKGSTSIDAGKTFTVGETEHRTNTSATNITITDTDPDFWFCGNSTEPGNQTYTLPTAADNIGRIITFLVTTDPGANYVRVDGEGAETVDGTAIQATTDAVGTELQVVCDGTSWYELNSIGTWGGHA